MYQIQTKQFTINARDIWKKLDSKRKFSDWIQEQIKKYNFKPDVDFIHFTKNVKRENGATILKEYLFKESSARLILEDSKNFDKSLYFRKQHDMKNSLESLMKNPRKLATALLDYADQIERLEIENEIQGSKLQLLTKQSHHFTSTQVGQEIGVSAKKLNSVLQSMKYIYYQSGTWIGTDKIKSKGYLTTKEILDINGKIFYHSYWTESGRLWLLENKKWFL